jgi:lipase maturation factor 1
LAASRDSIATNHSASRYIFSRWLFLRVLAGVYLIAFASLVPQIPGLIGEHGITPAGPDGALLALAAGGCLVSLSALIGFLTIPALIACYVLYLNFTTMGSVFLMFQWDALLLETGFLAIFLAPRQLLEKPWDGDKYSVTPTPMPFVWLLRWLVFRVVFQSGCVKLLSGDPTWWNMTALQYHFWTQPLPTPIGWWFAQLPPPVLNVLTVMLFVMELVVPFLIFTRGKLRLLGAVLLALLQLFIALTGNYTFFNLLTASMLILLIDDAQWKRLLPKRFGYQVTAMPPNAFGRIALRVLAGFIVFCTSMQVFEMFVGYRGLPRLASSVMELVAPLRVANSYGVFAVMTTQRIEIIVEGSNDGSNWSQYQFPYKPGDLRRPPPWVAPYQPRLDWQMWFAALGTVDDNGWFISFMRALLKGEKPVLALLSSNPFRSAPPKFIRAQAFQYRFTTPEELARTGCWWKRTYAGEYFPAASLR